MVEIQSLIDSTQWLLKSSGLYTIKDFRRRKKILVNQKFPQNLDLKKIASSLYFVCAIDVSDS